MRVIASAAALVLAACAPAVKKPTTTVRTAQSVFDEDDDDDDAVCKEERETGTNMPRQICRTQGEVNEERDAAKTWLKRPRADPTDVQ
jgi:hypothetical protein